VGPYGEEETLLPLAGIKPSRWLYRLSAGLNCHDAELCGLYKRISVGSWLEVVLGRVVCVPLSEFRNSSVK
jgi:hypothetical protein